MAFPSLTDPIYSDYFLENDGFNSSWLQSISSTSTLNGNDDYFTSPHDLALNSTTYMEPETVEMWEIENSALKFDSLLDSDSIASLNHSRTPSLCDDADNLPPTPTQTEHLPTIEASSKRKRGRPRLASDDSESSYSDSSRSRKSGINKRQPHHEVERKYREGLNAGLERLRMSVPTLLHLDSQSGDSLPRPSKATVLASAIDYIQQVEMECDRLRKENEILKTGNRMAALRFSIRS